MSYVKAPYLVAVSTSVVKLQDPVTPGGVRIRSRVYKNLGTASVFLGGPSVAASTANGWELTAGEVFQDSITNGDIYAIAASGSHNVQVWEAIN